MCLNCLYVSLFFSSLSASLNYNFTVFNPVLYYHLDKSVKKSLSIKKEQILRMLHSVFASRPKEGSSERELEKIIIGISCRKVCLN